MPHLLCNPCCLGFGARCSLFCVHCGIYFSQIALQYAEQIIPWWTQFLLNPVKLVVFIRRQILTSCYVNWLPYLHIRYFTWWHRCYIMHGYHSLNWSTGSIYRPDQQVSNFILRHVYQIYVCLTGIDIFQAEIFWNGYMYVVTGKFIYF